MLWWVLACAKPEVAGPPSRPSGPTAVDTGTFVPTGALEATCERVPDNALRFDCAVEVEVPQAVTLAVWAADEPDRVRRFSSEAGLHHDLRVWGVPPETQLVWRAEAGTDHRTGTMRSGELPAGVLTTYDVLVDAEDAEVEGVLFAPSCAVGWLMIVDRAGRVVWYQDLSTVIEDQAVTISSVHRTPEDTVLVTLSRNGIVEIDLAGNVLLDLQREQDFDEYIHHDVYRHADVTYTLFSSVVEDRTEDYVIDGVYAFRDGALLDQFTIEGVWPLQAHPSAVNGYWTGIYPDHVDFSHANAVSVGPTGDLVLSFRHLHAVASFRNGPGTAGFGELLWTLVGDDLSVLAPGDFVLDADPGLEGAFSGQHDAHFANDGTLLLFDNRYLASGFARGQRIVVDTPAGTARVVATWDTDLACAVQGSVRQIEDDVLVTCQSGGHVLEFAPGAPQPIWHMTGLCDGAVSVAIARSIPWDLWDPAPR